MPKSTQEAHKYSNLLHDVNNVSIGERIREERLALGLSQAEFSKRLSVNRRSQGHYETGTSAPDAIYLQKAFQAGVDVGYVLTGNHADYQHKAMVMVIGMMFDELNLTRYENEFLEICTKVQEEYTAFMHEGGASLARETEARIRTLLKNSPKVLQADVMADVIERLEFVAETKGMQLSPHTRAAAIIRLYREARVNGSPPDLQAVATAIET